MTNVPSDSQRRTLLQVVASMAAVGQFGISPASAATTSPAASGAAGDFDFLSGSWKIKHRQLKDNKWDLFEGEASVFAILGGVASVEELRIPDRKFSGMGLRLLDIERKLWADYWVNGKSGILNSPSWGSLRMASESGNRMISMVISLSSCAACGIRLPLNRADGIRQYRVTRVRPGKKIG